jgi:hypothetical protein
MKILIQKTNQVVHIICWPVTYLVEKLHVKKVVKSKRATKIIIGIGITLTGSTMASHPVMWVPHFLWDAFAYTLHGYGALPMIKLACERLNLESIEETTEAEIEHLEHRLVALRLEAEKKQNLNYDL